ncbi:hypothetical protein DDR33_25065, partial [Pararcticibacter amylolyticus]
MKELRLENIVFFIQVLNKNTASIFEALFCNNNPNILSLADVLYYSDYYPFGSDLTLANSDYRYGYQGQCTEKDKEITWLNFALRMYDPTIGRWMTMDPYGQYYSPYVGMGNDPVNGVEPDGGYTRFGALWRHAVAYFTGRDPGPILKPGSEYGFNTHDSDNDGEIRVNAHYGRSVGQKEAIRMASMFYTAPKVGQ